ncbi:MAG: sigma-70 family RNA polymerase sigma factor [Lentisphaeria bacterium]|nr:sigma-70 family RNA polymerase sigma factor [Lentisphaeria bacterium]
MQTEEEKKLQMQETAELIAAFKDGKLESFDKLVIMYSPQLYRTAYGLLGSKQDAEEVVQDAFVRAFRALNNFRGDSSFETWMHRITVNLARNKFHWNRRRGEGQMTSISHVSDDEREQRDLLFPDDRLRPDFSLENSEIEHEIMDGLSRLPESLRETMVLRHLSDLPYEKIAEQLSCKVGTVKSRLARGRELLREYLVSKEIPENQTKRSI